MALMLLQQAWVRSPMLPCTRFPEASAGIWPETKTWPLARTAWDCGVSIGILHLFAYSRGLVGLGAVSHSCHNSDRN